MFARCAITPAASVISHGCPPSFSLLMSFHAAAAAFHCFDVFRHFSASFAAGVTPFVFTLFRLLSFAFDS
jgi:hypothetical protein